jgi:hypothetical protein
MRLAPSRAAKSSFPPVFPLLSDTVISPLFPGIRGRLSLAIVPNLSPMALGQLGGRDGHNRSKKGGNRAQLSGTGACLWRVAS